MAPKNRGLTGPFLLALCSGAIILLISSVTALAALSPEWTITQVVTNTADQINPAISGQSVIWQDYRNTGSGCPSVNNCTAADIYVRQLPGAEQRLTSTPNGMDPDIDGVIAVWRNWSTGKIIVHNLSTSAEQNASTIGGTVQQVTPAVSGNRVVWVDYRTSPNYGEIWMRDLGQSTDQPVSQASTSTSIPDAQKDKRNPDINGNIVVWEDWRNAYQDAQGWWHNPDIYMKDLSTGTESPVCANTADQYAPVVSGNKVAWQDYRNNKWDIYMKDLTTGVETRVTTDANDDTWPSISGDYLVWKSSPRYSSLSDIVMERISTGVQTAVTADAALQKLPQVSGASFVWLDNTAGNWDIYKMDDTVAPQVASLLPSGMQNTMPATLSALYSDGGSGVDTSSVSLRLDGAPLAGCTVSGTRVDCPAGALPQGAHTLSVSLSDVAGNQAAGSSSFTIDTVPPAVSGIGPSGWQTSGSLVLAGSFSDSGSGIDTGSVQVTLDGVPQTGCTVNAGSVSCPAGGIADGHHAVAVSVADLAGNTASGSGSFDVDTAGPAVTLTAAFNSGTDAIDINAVLSDPAPGSGVDPASVQVSVNGAALSGCAISAAAASCSMPVSSSGAYGVHVSAKDVAGNSGAADASVSVADTVAPAVGPVSITPVASGVQDGVIVAAGYSDPLPSSGIDTASVSVTLDGAALSGCAISDTAVSCSGPGLGLGMHSATVSVSDNAGNGSSAQGSLNVPDTVAPDITVTGPNGTVPGPSTTISAAIADPAPSSGVNAASVVVRLDGTLLGTCTVTAASVSCPTGNLLDGAHSAQISAADNAGNLQVASWSFSIAPGSPVISNLVPAAAATVNNPWPVIGADYFDGTGIDTASVRVAVDGLDLTGAASVTAGAVSVQVPWDKQLADGKHTAHVSVSDISGNLSQQDWQFTVVSPSLQLSALKIYWLTYQDYLNRLLSVDYQMANNGSGACGSGQVAVALATNGVAVYDPLPLSLGNIAAGSSSYYTLRYLVPAGVGHYVATSYASCTDDGTNLHWFAGPPPVT